MDKYFSSKISASIGSSYDGLVLQYRTVRIYASIVQLRKKKTLLNQVAGSY